MLLVAGGFPPAEANGIRSGWQGNPGRRGVCERQGVTGSNKPSAKYAAGDTDTAAAQAFDMFRSDLPDSFFDGIFEQIRRCDSPGEVTMIDFNELERRASRFFEAGRFQDAIAVYLSMADGDPSLDAGHLAYWVGRCREALGELHAAKWWYGIAVQENPAIPAYQDARQRLKSIDFDTLPIG